MTDDQHENSEDMILETIREAEPVLDAVETLLLKSATDKGAPFTPEAIEFLRDLKARNPENFEGLRARLKNAGVRVTELDKLILKLADQGRGGPTSRELTFEEVTPADEVVDGAELLNDIVKVLQRFLSLPAYSAEAIALWIVFAHSHDCWSISPRLAFNSPEKRCGKTTALAIVHGLVPRPLSSANITPAAVFRSVEEYRPTLLIDEADTFLKGNDELRGILNSGHNRSSAHVIRVTGDDHKPTMFSTWAPLAIAMIGKLPDTLNDRSITVQLKRKSPNERVERLRLDRLSSILDPLKARIARWVLDNRDQFADWDGDVPHDLHDRAADNWRPLVAIADVAGRGWGDRARAAAVALTSRNDEQSAGVQLLGDIRDLFHTLEADRLKSQDILKALVGMEDRPWADWGKGKSMTPSQLAKMLRPFGIYPGTARFQNGPLAKGYLLSDFKDAFARYLPDAAVTPEHVRNINGLAKPDGVTSRSPVTAEVRPKLLNTRELYGVTASEPVEQRNGAHQLAPESQEKRIRRVL